MYNDVSHYQYPYYHNFHNHNVSTYSNVRHPGYENYVNEIENYHRFLAYRQAMEYRNMLVTDYGPNPLVANINQAAKLNNTYRTALWSGKHLQVTLMSIAVGGDVGVEMHSNLDQFLRIEQGQGLVQMGETKDNLSLQAYVSDDSAIIVPAGIWHNLINTGHSPLKLYSIYAPPNHPFGTVQATKADAIAMENDD